MDAADIKVEFQVLAIFWGGIMPFPAPFFNFLIL
jgi:hypothetical protein